MRKSPLALIATGLLTASAVAEVNYETLYFINEDGSSFVTYATTRSSFSSYNVFFPKGSTLDDYLYIFPNQHRFDVTSSDTNEILRFEQGSYALISQGDYASEDLVTVSSDGTHTLRTWNGEHDYNEHYGYWNDPEDYTNFAIAWVFPKQFEIVSYRSNREGDWVRRQNTLTYFGYDVNDLTFEVSYRARTQKTFAALQESFEDTDDVAVEQASDQVKVIMSNAILFPPGSVSLSDGGIALLRDVAGKVIEDDSIRIVVEGHTDDVPITGFLQTLYATNWELSAARALRVIHQLVEAGIPADRLEVHAFGENHPRVPNTTDEMRAENRRIELVLIPVDEEPQLITEE